MKSSLKSYAELHLKNPNIEWQGHLRHIYLSGGAPALKWIIENYYWDTAFNLFNDVRYAFGEQRALEIVEECDLLWMYDVKTKAWDMAILLDENVVKLLVRVDCPLTILDSRFFEPIYVGQERKFLPWRVQQKAALLWAAFGNSAPKDLKRFCLKVYLYAEMYTRMRGHFCIEEMASFNDLNVKRTVEQQVREAYARQEMNKVMDLLGAPNPKLGWSDNKILFELHRIVRLPLAVIFDAAAELTDEQFTEAVTTCSAICTKPYFHAGHLNTDERARIYLFEGHALSFEDATGAYASAWLNAWFHWKPEKSIYYSKPFYRDAKLCLSLGHFVVKGLAYLYGTMHKHRIERRFYPTLERYASWYKSLFGIAMPESWTQLHELPEKFERHELLFYSLH